MIKKTIGREYKSEPQDILRTKSALQKPGYYATPEYGLTEYADNQLFAAIRNFQNDEGLKPTGIIRAGDKTNARLAQRMSNGLDEDDEDVDAKSPTIWCPICGGPHGGSQGDACPDCTIKK